MNIAVISKNEFEYTDSSDNIIFIADDEKMTAADWKQYDAAFLVEPFSDTSVKYWTGHPHLRAIKSKEELKEELAALHSNIEIEKKFLIAYPNIDTLRQYNPFMAEIEQVYLLSDKGSRRIRKRVSNGVTSYVETLKVRISGEKSYEYENRLTEAEYNEMLLMADSDKHQIRKNRYCFLYKNQYFELDVYEFWKDKATLELELRNEDQPYVLPPEISVIADVSGDYKFKNNYLASIPYENY